MRVIGGGGVVNPIASRESPFARLEADVRAFCPPPARPIRFAITAMQADRWECEVEALGERIDSPYGDASIFSFRRRGLARTTSFNVAMLVPTGIDCAIGGHAGDATPAARLLAAACDTLILHPNVVNASDINEQPDNALYVEGSALCGLLMGNLALQRVRSNRILVVTEDRPDNPWAVDQVVNTANAARAVLGVDCARIVVLERGVSMRLTQSPAGRASGEIAGLGSLFDLLTRERASYDAVALATHVSSADTRQLNQDYFRSDGPNPWGGVEAALTHAVCNTMRVPVAHAPTLEEPPSRSEPVGVVEPRKAAEAISTGFFYCVLKGLHRAPRLVAPAEHYDPSLLNCEDVSCLVQPDGSVGLPTLAALCQGIPVIAVRDNTNCMRNDLQRLPFAPGQLSTVNNYLEAAGLLIALHAGIHPGALTRPLVPAAVVRHEH